MPVSCHVRDTTCHVIRKKYNYNLSWIYLRSKNDGGIYLLGSVENLLGSVICSMHLWTP